MKDSNEEKNDQIENLPSPESTKETEKVDICDRRFTLVGNWQTKFGKPRKHFVQNLKKLFKFFDPKSNSKELIDSKNHYSEKPNDIIHFFIVPMTVFEWIRSTESLEKSQTWIKQERKVCQNM